MGYKIAIVEDDKLILELITNFLASSKKFERIDSYNTGNGFLSSIETKPLEVDVIVLDFKLGDTDAEKILEKLNQKQLNIPVIILTSFYNQYLMGYMIKLGTAAYLPKNIKPSELLSIIEDVIQKGYYISPEQFPFLKISLSEDSNPLIKKNLDITERSIEVIHLLANQLTAKEIAEKLYVSPKTVEGYKNALFLKTGTKTIVGLVLFAIQNEILDVRTIDLTKGVE